MRSRRLAKASQVKDSHNSDNLKVVLHCVFRPRLKYRFQAVVAGIDSASYHFSFERWEHSNLASAVVMF